MHSWIIVIAHIRFQGSGPSVPSQPAHASSPLCLHASDDPSSQAARRIVAPIGCRAKWRRTRSCTARLHDGASWPGVSCRMLPPESSGSRPALFRASCRRYSTSVRGIASCDSVATCMRHYVASPSWPALRRTYRWGSRALALSFPPSASLLIQRWAVLTDTPPALASSAAAGDPSRSMIDATRSLISSRPDPATDHATGTLARNTASFLRCLLYSSLDGEIAA